MQEKRKKHIARLPITDFTNYEITTHDVAITIPLFHSPVDSGFTAYNEKRIKDIHVKGAIWVALSLINNTDLADKGVGIYFHLEDKIYDIARDVFDSFGVPDKFIRIMTINDFESDNVNAAQYGKKYMFLEDTLKPKQWVMIDSDAFVCTSGKKFEWYDTFKAFGSPSAMNVQPAVYHTDKEYAHWVQMCSHGAGYAYDREKDLIEQERRALLKLEVPEGYLELGASQDAQRAYTCTQILVLPTSHKIIDYIKRHWKNCHWDEGMLNVWQMLHKQISFLPDKLGGLRKYQFESEYVGRDKALDEKGYLAHILPDNREEELLVDAYFDDFFHALQPPEQNPIVANTQKGEPLMPKTPSEALAASSSDKERDGAHRYGKFYDNLFDVQTLRQKRPLRILEIGVSEFGAGSLGAWQSLKSVQEVVGVDIDKYQGRLKDKTTFYQKDAYTNETIELLKKNHDPFDIIIDDGSHTQKDQTFFLQNYGKLLSSGGQLICEDIADDDFFRRMCKEGVYGIDLSANRPEKEATDTHNDRILIKDADDLSVSDTTPPVKHPKVFAAPKMREGHTLHMFGIPYAHGGTIPTCPFDQRVWKSGEMWTELGYNTIYYGHKGSQVSCVEHVPVSDDTILEKAYGQANYNFIPPHEITDSAFKTFAANTESELRKRVKKDDLVLAFYGQGHKALCDAISDLPIHIVEPSIGYPDPFSENRVYQSISYMHFCRGQAAQSEMLQRRFPELKDKINIKPWNVCPDTETRWNDCVIPNFFNVDDFEYSEEKEDWLCYIGRIHECKGLEIIFDLAEATDTHVKIAGPGDIKKLGFHVPKQIEFLGIADRQMRKELFKRAKALICPSLYLEPFLGTHVECLFAGNTCYHCQLWRAYGIL